MKKICEGIIQSKKRLLVALFLGSLFVRFLLVFPLVQSKAQIKFDEKNYYSRAEAFHSIFKNLVSFKSPRVVDKNEAYKKGIWPPFQAAILGFGFLIFGKSIAAARLMVVLLSALTTPLVFLLTAKLANKNAGIGASLIHIFYPSFLAFSHFLWSETTFIFLLFLALYLTFRIPEVEMPKRKVWRALILGITLGLLALTRAAALFFLFLIPAWLILNLKGRRDKILIPLMTVITLIAVIFPWEYTLLQKEKKFILLSNYTYRNLYHGNNPWVRNGFGCDSIDCEFQPHRMLRKYKKANAISIEQAAKDLANAEIRGHFGAFVLRSFNKFFLLWTFDFFILRHMLNAIYPPLPGGTALFIFFLIVLSCIFFYVCVVKGFFAKEIPLKHLLFLLILVAVGMFPYLVAYSHTRYNLPQLALLLPLAGIGLANIRKKYRWFKITALATILCFLALSFYSYHHFLYKKCYPSSYYRGTTALLDKLFNRESILTDVINIKTDGRENPDRLTLSITGGDNYSFERDTDVKEITLNIKGFCLVTIFSQHPGAPLVLSIYSENREKAVRVEPISRAYWNKYRPVMANLSMTWCGGR